LTTLETWGGRSTFQYEGEPTFSGAQYAALVSQFQGQTVSAGPSRDNPQSISVGQWLKDNVTKTAIASYVCPILVHHGLAEKRKDKILFKQKG